MLGLHFPSPIYSFSPLTVLHGRVSGQIVCSVFCPGPLAHGVLDLLLLFLLGFYVLYLKHLNHVQHLNRVNRV